MAESAASPQGISNVEFAQRPGRSLEPYFPETDLKYGIGLQDAGRRLGPGSYGHGAGCGTQLIVNPQKHLVVAMVRNDRGKNYDQHLSETMALLREWIEQ